MSYRAGISALCHVCDDFWNKWSQRLIIQFYMSVVEGNAKLLLHGVISRRTFLPNQGFFQFSGGLTKIRDFHSLGSAPR